MPRAQILEAFAGHPGGRLLVATLGDDPAANTEISVTVPGRAQWRVHAISAVLVTDATVANRRPRFTFSHQGRTYYSVAGQADHTASTTVRYSAAEGIAGDAQVASGRVVLPLPPLMLLPGSVFETETANLQSGDNWGAPVLYVTEIPERGPAVWDELVDAFAREVAERRFTNA